MPFPFFLSEFNNNKTNKLWSIIDAPNHNFVYFLLMYAPYNFFLSPYFGFLQLNALSFISVISFFKANLLMYKWYPTGWTHFIFIEF